MSTVTVNGLRALSTRIFQPYNGVWYADIDVDPDLDPSTVPTVGPAAIAIDSIPPVALTGFIDPKYSGQFVASVRLRVVGGRNGWSQTVPAQDFQNPAGVLSPEVLVPTGALVGELVTVVVPSLMGTASYERAAGPASQVLADLAWWADPTTGTTFVGAPRPPAVPDPTLEILSFDPQTQTAELTCDTLIAPGTILVDPRLGATPLMVRDVDQTFDGAGAKAVVWCASNPVSTFTAALTTLVRGLAKTSYLKTYRYRVVSPGPGAPDTAWVLQAVDRDPLTGAAAPMPDISAALVWPGMAGVLATLPPALEVLVKFVNGDPGDPVIVGFSTLALPTKLTLDALAVEVGPTAPVVSLGGGTTHGVAFADLVLAELVKIGTATGGSYTAPASAALIGSVKVVSG